MSTDVTMQELELETAELLPARETLWGYYSGNTAIVGSGNGNTEQAAGLINVSLLNGNFNGDFNNVNQ